MLGVWAHPDDEAYLMAGTALAASAAGSYVACVTATAGEAGETADESRWPQARLAEIRREEMRACLEVLGIDDHEWLGLPDGGLCSMAGAEGVAQIAAAVQRLEPDTILTFGPEGMTGHLDHVIDLRSPAFSPNTTIPPRYARDGDNLSPPLEWSDVPDRTVELALICEDPDAPSGTFTHGIVTGIDPGTRAVAEGSEPSRAIEWPNDFGHEGYDGPQPPIGDDPHRYFFRLFALDGPVSASRIDIDELRATREKQQLATGTLIGLYARQRSHARSGVIDLPRTIPAPTRAPSLGREAQADIAANAGRRPREGTSANHSVPGTGDSSTGRAPGAASSSPPRGTHARCL